MATSSRGSICNLLNRSLRLQLAGACLRHPSESELHREASGRHLRVVDTTHLSRLWSRSRFIPSTDVRSGSAAPLRNTGSDCLCAASTSAVLGLTQPRFRASRSYGQGPSISSKAIRGKKKTRLAGPFRARLLLPPRAQGGQTWQLSRVQGADQVKDQCTAYGHLKNSSKIRLGRQGGAASLSGATSSRRVSSSRTMFQWCRCAKLDAWLLS